jgi:hypothetical protein
MGSTEPRDLSRYLDGELVKAELPEELRREAEGFERLMAQVDRGAARLPYSIREAVMERVRASQVAWWQRSWSWVATPRTLRVSPLAGVLAAAAVAAMVIFARPTFGPVGGASVTQSSQMVPVRFVFQAPGASRVAVTGEFARWDPSGVAMKQTSEGTWMAEIELPAGLHHYAFVVDGTRWAPDPNAASQVDDGFGKQNSVLLVTGVGARSS